MAKISEREFLKRAAADAGVDRALMQRCWPGIVNTFIDLYCDGDQLTVRDLGVFRLRKTKPRVGYDFKTGQKNVRISAGATPFFKPCEALRKVANANYKDRVECGEEFELDEE